MIKVIAIILLLCVHVFAQTEIHQGEAMTVVAGPDVLANDSTLIYYSWGTAVFQSEISGDVKIIVRAKEDYAGEEHAKFEIECPNFIDTLDIDTNDLSDYLIYADVYPGEWSLSFINGYYTLDRNIHLDYVVIENINQFPDTGKMVVTWHSNTEPDLAGYKVYYGNESRNYTNVIDVGNVTEKLVTGLKFYVPWYVAVTAYDTANNESSFSQEVSITLHPDTTYYLLGDYNKDGIVDFLDMYEFDKTFGLNSDNVNFNNYFDFNSDGIVDFSDMVIFDSNFGKNNSGAVYVKN